MRWLLYPFVFASFFGPLSGSPTCRATRPIGKRRTPPAVPAPCHGVHGGAGTAVALGLPSQTWLSSRTAWMRMFSSYHSANSEKLRSTAARKVASASLNASGS